MKNEIKMLKENQIKFDKTYRELKTQEVKLSNEIETGKDIGNKTKKLIFIQKNIENIKEQQNNLQNDYETLKYNFSKLENENENENETIAENNKRNSNIKYNIVVIDKTITNTDLETMRKDFSFDLFMELKMKFMKKYSILIKPNDLHHNRHKWFKKGIFRIEKDSVYDILSFSQYVDIKKLIQDNVDIIEFKDDGFDNDRKLALIEKLRLARERDYTSKNDHPLEIKTEKINSVQEYKDFIENREVFSRFIFEGITEKNIKDKIKMSDVHQYTNNILKNIDKKYEYTVFPYNENNPIRIYFVVFLQNRLKLDPLYEKFEMKIANTIGDFGDDPKIKGIIIQSVNFENILYYDPVQVFKIRNDDNYFIWMKPEYDKVDGLKIYESHMKNMNMIKNNLHKKIDATKLQGGIRNTVKVKPTQNKNKTVSNRNR